MYNAIKATFGAFGGVPFKALKLRSFFALYFFVELANGYYYQHMALTEATQNPDTATLTLRAILVGVGAIVAPFVLLVVQRRLKLHVLMLISLVLMMGGFVGNVFISASNWSIVPMVLVAMSYTFFCVTTYIGINFSASRTTIGVQIAIYYAMSYLGWGVAPYLAPVDHASQGGMLGFAAATLIFGGVILHFKFGDAASTGPSSASKTTSQTTTNSKTTTQPNTQTQPFKAYGHMLVKLGRLPLRYYRAAPLLALGAFIEGWYEGGIVDFLESVAIKAQLGPPEAIAETWTQLYWLGGILVIFGGKFLDRWGAYKAFARITALWAVIVVLCMAMPLTALSGSLYFTAWGFYTAFLGCAVLLLMDAAFKGQGFILAAVCNQSILGVGSLVSPLALTEVLEWGHTQGYVACLAVFVVGLALMLLRKKWSDQGVGRLIFS